MKKNSIFTPLGASNHSKTEREKNDFYATEPKATELLLENESFNKNVLEPACGLGHISEVLKNHGYNVSSSDLIERGYGGTKDFFELDKFNGDIITNPPYTIGNEFVQHALDVVDDGAKVAMFLKLQFLEGKARKKFFLKNPPRTIYVSSSRLKCAKNGEFEKVKSSAVAYAWYVWEKGYKEKPQIEWIN